MDPNFIHDGIVSGRWLLWIPVLPLLGAVINGTLGHWAPKRTVSVVAVGSVVASFLLGLGFWGRLLTIAHPAGAEMPSGVTTHAYDWFTVTLNGVQVPVGVSFTMDHLSLVMTLVVTGVGALIHLYAVGYMALDKSYARFFCYLNLFTAAMLILVLASNMPLMFVGWEGVGLCSYLLIGFWWENPAYAAAGRKAFVMNRIGDFGVLIGMFLLASAASSFDFSTINSHAYLLNSGLQLDHNSPPLAVTTGTVACLFLFLGCTGKSAQIPLYVWLPDAMAGPTPVSALIHAATMVTSGIYLCVRLSPVFVTSPIAMSTIAIIGAATALLAATIALVQNEMKKILAYSTVSQLGFMFAGVGVGSFSGGLFHVFTHAFFKACLFLGAGSVMHAVGAHGDADIRKLGGLREKLPTTHWTFLVACLAIAGVPGLSGFFSKDEILFGAVLGGQSPWAEFPSWVGWTVFGTLALAAAMTAFYMFRLYFVTFGGHYRRTLDTDGHADEHGYDEHPHESPQTMTIPLVVLAAGAIIVGVFGLPTWIPNVRNVWEPWLEPNVAHLPRIGDLAASASTNAGIIALGTSVAAMLIGIGLAWSFYGREGNEAPDRVAQGFGPFYRGAMHKWYVDEIYGVIVVRPMQWLSRFSSAFDKAVVDGILAGFTALTVRFSSWLFTRPQNGVVYAYGTVMVVGVAVLLGWVVIPHPGLQHAVQGNEVKLVAGTGLGYEYRWDTNGDGAFDTEWSKDDNKVDTTYDDAKDFVGGAVVITSERRGLLGQGEHREEIVLHAGEWYTLGEDELGVAWQAVPGQGAPPGITWRHDKVIVRPNGAVAMRGTQPINEETELSAGDVVVIGISQIRAAAVVRSTVEVRNAFGYVAHESAELVIAPAPAAHAVLEGGR